MESELLEQLMIGITIKLITAINSHLSSVFNEVENNLCSSILLVLACQKHFQIYEIISIKNKSKTSKVDL